MSNSEINALVVEQINLARQAYASTTDALRAAAELASEELNRELTPEDSVMDVLNRYREFFGDSHNLKATFKDFLLLQYADDVPVSTEVERLDKNGRAVLDDDGNPVMIETHVTAADAARDFSKHAMRAAAKEVREHFGIARKSGGGRNKAAKASDVVTLTALIQRVLEAETGLDSLKEILNPLGYNVVRKRN